MQVLTLPSDAVVAKKLHSFSPARSTAPPRPNSTPGSQCRSVTTVWCANSTAASCLQGQQHMVTGVGYQQQHAVRRNNQARLNALPKRCVSSMLVAY
jgi:hypothetical protein